MRILIEEYLYNAAIVASKYRIRLNFSDED